jgi:hypothetical protein
MFYVIFTLRSMDSVFIKIRYNLWKINPQENELKSKNVLSF